MCGTFWILGEMTWNDPLVSCIICYSLPQLITLLCPQSMQGLEGYSWDLDFNKKWCKICDLIAPEKYIKDLPKLGRGCRIAI